jgi:hypothetical protein
MSMSHTPHELSAEFPDKADAIRDLRAADPHFVVMTDEYHTINRAIHRAETNVEPTDDANLTSMRKERLMLKDQIWARVSAA